MVSPGMVSHGATGYSLKQIRAPSLSWSRRVYPALPSLESTPLDSHRTPSRRAQLGLRCVAPLTWIRTNDASLFKTRPT